ncbi:flagellar basal body rod protein FlgC [Desulfosporosinus sp. Sb-LF]|uniref:flagellar basal body rod protein FlgC n=1 Tax=Desulfosporosinus sp. Sb-LF TaxID=2560027 RepID=UPI00107F16DA|nr:flagellar basal body rod protein FlgC [Desulfosporosinus sp. Sb-LF]TGE32610.1 flagellar basal body rod protein FlgC [Desulfosporosinus sp. Sb-LF]
MSLFGAIDISASGLTAQRLRLDLISNNIANINTTRTGELTPGGNPIPYSRQAAVFVPRPSETPFANVLGETLGDRNVGNGVQVSSIERDVQAPFRLEYNPDSPDAAKVAEPGLPVGYVRQPNVNIVTEMVDMISASRAYEANVTALNASKSMAAKALEIGKG